MSEALLRARGVLLRAASRAEAFPLVATATAGASTSVAAATGATSVATLLILVERAFFLVRLGARRVQHWWGVSRLRRPPRSPRCFLLARRIQVEPVQSSFGFLCAALRFAQALLSLAYFPYFLPDSVENIPAFRAFLHSYAAMYSPQPQAGEHVTLVHHTLLEIRTRLI